MKDCILFYVKVPEKGKVKTRLSKDLGDEKTLELYKVFVLDILEVISKIKIDVRICFTPKEGEDKIKKWLKGDFFSQKGDDLGARMRNSFKEAFEEYEKVIIIGSDSPDLRESLIRTGFKELEKNDAVIGPSSDGGYYLLGFTKQGFFPEVFDTIEWSTSTVYSETLRRIRERKIKFSILQEEDDVDTIEDLKRLIEKSKDTRFKDSRTIKLLDEWGM